MLSPRLQRLAPLAIDGRPVGARASPTNGGLLSSSSPFHSVSSSTKPLATTRHVRLAKSLRRAPIRRWPNTPPQLLRLWHIVVVRGRAPRRARRVPLPSAV